MKPDPIPPAAQDDSIGAWIMIHPRPTVLQVDFPDQRLTRFPLTKWILFLLALIWLAVLTPIASISPGAFALLLIFPIAIYGVLWVVSPVPIRSLKMDGQQRQMRVTLGDGPGAFIRTIPYNDIRSIDFESTQWGRPTRIARIIVRPKFSPNIVLYQLGVNNEQLLHAWLNTMLEQR